MGILISSVMILYYALTLFGEQLGMESAGSRYFGLKKPSVIQAAGAKWTGIFLLTAAFDSLYVCYKCSEGARLRFCNVGMMLALSRFMLQVSHSCPKLRSVTAHGTDKEFLPGIIVSFIFMGLFANVVSNSTLPAGRNWYSPNTTTGKALLGVALMHFFFLANMSVMDWTANYTVKRIGSPEFAQADWCVNLMASITVHVLFALTYLDEEEQGGFAKVRVFTALACLYQAWCEKSISTPSAYQQGMIMITFTTLLGVFAVHNTEIMQKLKLA